MPHDRRSRRVLLAMLGLVGVTISVGCLRSSNLRTSAGPLPELSPAGELHPVVGGSTTAGANPPSTTPWPNPGGCRGPASGGTSGGPCTDSGLVNESRRSGRRRTSRRRHRGGEQPRACGGPAASPAPAGAAPGPSESPTPLLDAEIRRARAITRQHFESLSAVEASPPVTAPVDAPAARPAPAPIAEPVPADPDPDLIAPLPPLAASTRTAIEPEQAGSAARITLPTLMPIDPSAPGSAGPVSWHPRRPSSPTARTRRRLLGPRRAPPFPKAAP